MASVFISYSNSDRDATTRLASELDGRGVTVWWDTEIEGGERFQEKIRSAIAEAAAVIVIWSKQSTTSPWVIWEATLAQSAGKLLPILMPDCSLEQVPPPFKENRTLQASETSDIFAALEKLKVKVQLPEADSVDRLKKINPSLPDKLHAFLGKCRQERLWIDTQQYIMLKLRNGGRDINFGLIDTERGKLDLGYTPWQLGKLGRVDIAEMYLEGLARLTGGNIIRDAASAPIKLLVGNSGPSLHLLLDQQAEWLGLLCRARDMLNASTRESTPA